VSLILVKGAVFHARSSNDNSCRSIRHSKSWLPWFTDSNPDFATVYYDRIALLVAQGKFEDGTVCQIHRDGLGHPVDAQCGQQ